MFAYRLVNVCDNDVKYGGVTFCGAIGTDENWLRNPMNEKMALLFTIDNDILNKIITDINLPSGMQTQIFSTYSDERYFLDDIVYFGDDVEFSYIKKGFTKVSMIKLGVSLNRNEEDFLQMGLKSISLDNIEFPMFSFVSKEMPKSVFGCEKLLDDYRFICQIYSSDIPSKDGGILGLSDAIGYLFLKKNITDYSDAGFFFVQTA